MRFFIHPAFNAGCLLIPLENGLFLRHRGTYSTATIELTVRQQPKLQCDISRTYSTASVELTVRHRPNLQCGFGRTYSTAQVEETGPFPVFHHRSFFVTFLQHTGNVLQEARNVVAYTINRMKVSRRFRAEDE
ncbi:hypothetical protein [Bacteroides zoogleoformans]|uniref:hypothetical protein n=1 Tax=Bacteroides zoogleoformans TaxID=28119 RepID=UPI00248E787A|nr:hypothetical protein [Bacteroides zoogleoformans]